MLLLKRISPLPQLISVRNDLENVKKENEMLQNNSLEKEDRAKNLLKNARNRVVQLTEEKNSLIKELNEIRARPKGSYIYSLWIYNLHDMFGAYLRQFYD